MCVCARARARVIKAQDTLSLSLFVCHCCLAGDIVIKSVCNRLAGQVVKASAPKAEGPEFESRLRRDFSGSSYTSDLKIGTTVATLPGAWRYMVNAGTGRPCVSIL